MNMNAVRGMARKMNVKPGSKTKKELIRCIQEAEGNSPCFKSGRPSCDQHGCCWRSDCKPGETAVML
jgi:hypothetical protein